MLLVTFLIILIAIVLIQMILCRCCKTAFFKWLTFDIGIAGILICILLWMGVFDVSSGDVASNRYLAIFISVPSGFIFLASAIWIIVSGILKKK